MEEVRLKRKVTLKRKGDVAEVKNESLENELKFWRQSLKNAMIKGDLNYAMHCDTIINKLKQEL
jgi:hypothetical protein